jgi:Protein of unknown function (DUF3572)
MSSNDPFILALEALIFVVSDDKMALRLLDMTGLTPDDLRVGAQDPAVLGAIIDFLESHEPDLIACANHLSVAPTVLIAARRKLVPQTFEDY